MIRITDRISLDESELVETFLRASGPGGQHVNTTESAVQLRFNARHSPSLPEEVRIRLERLAGARATLEGVIVITAREFRSQDRNREAARERLITLIRTASERPKPRRPTRPTLASKQRRLEGKAKRGAVKSLRRTKPTAE